MYDIQRTLNRTVLIKVFLRQNFKLFSVGTKTRERRIVRDSVRPHGQCPSDLKETSVCLADACFTFNFVNFAGKMECVRSDGIIVQGSFAKSLVTKLIELKPFRPIRYYLVTD